MKPDAFSFRTGLVSVEGAPHVGIEFSTYLATEKMIVVLDAVQAKTLSDSILESLSKLLENMDPTTQKKQ